MIEPNFSESQLQQVVNTEITIQSFLHTGKMYNPTVVNLIEEYNLGWDTAFYFPWLLKTPHPKHRGCNFFIQYKLSELVEGSRGNEYSSWGCSYLRFKIPYLTKNETTGKYIYDYNQFDRLKELADEGYYTYYATNHILFDYQLFRLADSQQLLDEIPFLDVSSIIGYHPKVTFTERSLYFLLHSDAKKIDIVRWEQIFASVRKIKGTALSEDVKYINEFLIRAEEKLEFSKERGFLYEKAKISQVTQPLRPVAEALIAAKYLRLYLNVDWYKVWE